MRDDYVHLTQKVNQAHMDIARHGASAPRVLRLATLCLALGQPGHAVAQVQGILDANAEDAVVIREALWLCALALALEIAILEGNVVGAPGLEIHAKTNELRAQALDLLGRIPEMDADENRLHRALKNRSSLAFIQDLVKVE